MNILISILAVANVIAIHDIGSAAEPVPLRSDADIQLMMERDSAAQTRVVTVKGCIAAPIENVWQTITNYEQYDELIPRCPLVVILDPRYARSLNDTITTPRASELLCNSISLSCNQDTSYLYNEIEIIFPIGKVRSVLEIVADSFAYSVRWRKIVGPMRVYCGEWRLQPSSSGTLVELRTEFRLHVWVPPFIVRGAINYYFPRILRILREKCQAAEESLLVQEP